ncbi:hypothetical protein D9M68_945250 [compost metagenome]
MLIVERQQQPAFAVVQDIVGARHIRAHGRHAAGHGFDRGDAEALVLTQQHMQIEGRHQQLDALLETGKHDSVVQARLLCLQPQHGFQRPRAHQHQI